MHKGENIALAQWILTGQQTHSHSPYLLFVFHILRKVDPLIDENSLGNIEIVDPFPPLKVEACFGLCNSCDWMFISENIHRYILKTVESLGYCPTGESDKKVSTLFFCPANPFQPMNGS